MADLDVPFLAIPRFVEVRDDMAVSLSSHEINSANSTTDGEYENLSDDRAEPVIVAATHQRNRSSNCIPSHYM